MYHHRHPISRESNVELDGIGAKLLGPLEGSQRIGRRGSTGATMGDVERLPRVQESEGHPRSYFPIPLA
jgi:hypothetical protein